MNDGVFQSCVLIVAYNRLEPLKKVIEATQMQGISDFCVVIDGPKNNTDKRKQRQILAYLHAQTSSRITIEHRQHNFGLALSLRSSITQILSRYDSVVVVEDDCLPLPGFFDFIFSGLKEFRDNKQIRSLCGYQFPIDAEKTSDEKAILLRRFNPWGWATWRDRWLEYPQDYPGFLEQMKREKLLERLPKDIIRDSLHQKMISGKADIWSLPWILLHYFTNTYSIFPSTSLIQNIGFDGSGTHSLNTDAFETNTTSYHLREFFRVPPKFHPDIEHRIQKIWNDAPRFFT